MKRKTGLLLSFGFLAVMASPVFAQDIQNRPSPVEPSNVLGPQLIAWSEIQKPQPIPEPVVMPKRTRDSERKPDQPANPSGQQPQKNDATADQHRPPQSSRQ